jgi:tetratricopeptide (TPR) repeat protein
MSEVENTIPRGFLGKLLSWAGHISIPASLIAMEALDKTGMIGGSDGDHVTAISVAACLGFATVTDLLRSKHAHHVALRSTAEQAHRVAEQAEHDRLFNHHLASAVGQTLADILKQHLSAVDKEPLGDFLDTPNRAADAFKALANSALMPPELADERLPGLIEAASHDPAQAWGDVGLWASILEKMVDHLNETRAGGMAPMEWNAAVRQAAAEACRQNFVRTFFNTIKSDLEHKGAAYASIHLRMMSDVVVLAKENAEATRRMEASQADANAKLDLLLSLINHEGQEIVTATAKSPDFLEIRKMAVSLSRLDRRLEGIDQRLQQIDAQIQKVHQDLREVAAQNENLVAGQRQTGRSLRKVNVLLIVSVIAVGVALGGGWWAYRSLHKTVEQSAALTTEKIRAHLLETAAETHRRELADAEKSTDWKQRQRLRDVADAANTARLARIDELASSFAEIDGAGSASTVFQELTRILSQQGVDEAIAYVATQQTAILKTIQARAAATSQQNRADLQPLLKAAALYENKGQPDTARDLYMQILAAEPNWPDALHDAVVFFIKEGDVAQLHTTIADAETQYAQAQHLAQRLADGEPGNSVGQRDLSVTYDRFGELARSQGKLDDASVAFGQSLLIAKKLAASDPARRNWQRDVAVSSNTLGDVALAQGKLDEAGRYYGAGLVIAQQLAQNAADTTAQSDLNVCYNRMGDLQAGQEKFDQATASYEQGLAIAKKLAAADPQNVAWQQDLTISYDRLGDVAVKSQKLDAAEENFAESLSLRQKLLADESGNTEYQRVLMVSYNKSGEIAALRQKLPQAADAYAHGLELAQKLTASDPGNTDWQRDLSISYERLYDVAVLQKNLDAAALAIEQCLAIREKLGAADPTNMQWQRDIWVTDVKSANVAIQQAKIPQALAFLEQALAVVDAMQKQGAYIAPNDGRLIATIRQMVAKLSPKK